MRLLLFLSALLAALSGATATAHAPRAQTVEVGARLSAPKAERSHTRIATRLPSTGRSTVAPIARTAPPISVVRLWMLRPRE